MSVFPEKEKKQEKVFNGSSTLPSFANWPLRIVIHHMDCDWQISVLNVSFLKLFLCLSLKNPRAAAMIMLFSPLFPSL